MQQKDISGGMGELSKILEKPLPKSDIKQKGPRKEYTLAPDQQELSDIYKTLHNDNGMTQHKFAVRLEIGPARLASYLYGRTSGVPDYILEAARTLAKSPEHIQNKYDGMSMPQILAKWAKKLSLPSADDAKIAPFIGVSISTVCRWRNKETRPSNVELIGYEAHVDKHARRIASSDARVKIAEEKKVGKKKATAMA